MPALKRSLCAFVLSLAIPVAASAQATIAGTVRDASGAVLPGVTVEAASPVLIEKLRTVVTDGTGQYQIIDLRPGSYAVTFSLAGFSTVKREGIELTGSFTATVNVDLKLGGVEETITVTGESPIVDVQNAAAQRVMQKDVVDAIPVGRSHQSLAILIPGLSTTAGINPVVQDVGGTNNLRLANAFTIHGGRTSDSNIQVDGFQIRNIGSFGNLTNMFPDMGATQEMTIDYAAGMAEAATGGVKINYVPREGGNRVNGSFFATGVNSSFQGDNFTDDLRARGLTQVNSLKKAYDVNGSVGGPILRDKLWFFASARRQMNDTYFAGLYFNRNAGDPTKWTYEPDLTQQADTYIIQPDINGRVTWQANQKHKFGFFYTHQLRDVFGDRASVSPESANHFKLTKGNLASASWSSPMTSRLLLDVRLATHGESLYNAAWQDDPNSIWRELIAVTEQGGSIPGLLYRGAGQAAGPTFIFAAMDAPFIWETTGSLSYVTGAHAFKVGFRNSWGIQELLERDIHSAISYRFNNGVPNLITMRASPVTRSDKLNAELGIYAQDKWTLRRLTVSAGVRFDYFRTEFPETRLGPGPLVPNRNLVVPAYDWYDWKDISPRFAGVYDLFGDGKTALKASIGRYVAAGDPTVGNVFAILANTVTRSWTDSNRDYVPDCDLLNLQINGECGTVSDLRFGQAIPSTVYDPEVLVGWGKRGYNWEFSTGVQHQLFPRVGIDVGYFRRIYGNFSVTDNTLVSRADYDAYAIVAPADPRLPNGGGYTVDDLFDLNPSRVGQVSNLVRFADDFGSQIEHWNGVDITINARPGGGVLLQGGLSTGRTSTDNCDIRDDLPEIGPTNRFCHVDTKFLTQVKLLGTYTVPRAGVLVSATFQSLPGPQVTANYVAANASIAPTLGRPLSGGAQNATINIVEPGTLYGERLNQLDMRLARPIRLGPTKLSVNFDIYNTFNANAVTSQNNNYAAWQVPLSILDGRLFKFSVQYDF
ncbi:MAG TPA: carboxypeptidase regulatory-like domain-containing protein [Vicinamibacterales bacterium]|nr:carboxypeptidase regulatory-like domain-containing protein [Vicinamibacterales bacterium]